MTGWAMLGLEAARTQPARPRQRAARRRSPTCAREVDRLRSAGDLERTILALEGAGLDPRGFGGQDLVAELRQRRDGDGSVDGQVNLTAFGVLALRAAGRRRARCGRSAAWLRGAQNDDGGWGFQPQAPSDADSTGAALQGLIAAGRAAGRHRERGRAGCAAPSAPAAASRSAASGVVNSQSTAWAVQGLAAAGGGGGARSTARRRLPRPAARRGRPLPLLASSDQTPVWVTAQALLAVERSRSRSPRCRAARSSRGGRRGLGRRRMRERRAPGPRRSPGTAPTPAGGGERRARRRRGPAAASGGGGGRAAEVERRRS